MKVLALTRYAGLGASSRLRSFQYKEPLRQRGIDLDLVPLFDDDYVRTIYARKGRVRLVLAAFARRLLTLVNARKYDAIWVEKEILPWLPAILELSLVPADMPLIADYDDAVFHRYDQHRSPLVRALLGRKLDRVMARSDLVVAGNDYLAARARSAGARRVEVVPTVVDLERYPMRPRASAADLTIGWIGSPSTAPYLDIVKPVLENLGRSHALRAVAIGARPDQVAHSLFVSRPWSVETEVEDLRAIDIGIMPLADSPWERGKCGYKLIQYMALGIPVVASPVGVNRQIVEDGLNGFWASDEESWSRGLGQLLESEDMRRAFGARGRNMVEGRYTLQVQAPILADLIATTIGSRSAG